MVDGDIENAVRKMQQCSDDVRGKWIKEVEERLPFWRYIDKDHTPFLSIAQLRDWVYLRGMHLDSFRCPWEELVFSPYIESSKISVDDGYFILGGGRTEEALISKASSEGEWLITFHGGFSLSLGTGRIFLDILEKKDDEDYLGDMQKGYLSLMDRIDYWGWIRRSSLLRFKELTGNYLFSPNTTLRLKGLYSHHNSEDLHAPADALASTNIDVRSQQVCANVKQGLEPALYLFDFGPNKTVVIKSLKEILHLDISFILSRYAEAAEGRWECLSGRSLSELLEVERHLTELGAKVNILQALHP